MNALILATALIGQTHLISPDLPETAPTEEHITAIKSDLITLKVEVERAQNLAQQTQSSIDALRYEVRERLPKTTTYGANGDGSYRVTNQATGEVFTAHPRDDGYYQVTTNRGSWIYARQSDGRLTLVNSYASQPAQAYSAPMTTTYTMPMMGNYTMRSTYRVRGGGLFGGLFGGGSVCIGGNCGG